MQIKITGTLFGRRGAPQCEDWLPAFTVPVLALGIACQRNPIGVAGRLRDNGGR